MKNRSSPASARCGTVSISITPGGGNSPCRNTACDSCLQLIDEGLNGRGKGLCRSCDFIDIDVVYTLTRSMRQMTHRFDEAKATLDTFADRYLVMRYAIDPTANERFDDLHCLFGSVCCLAELQSALPGKIITTRPLKLVLDRRPFI